MTKSKIQILNIKNKILSFVILIFICHLSFVICHCAFAQPSESEQQINDFSLAGYGEKGIKSWDISGKSADIFGDVIKLKDITGNMYGEAETVKLTADKGDFNKVESKVHLEEDVVITTASGAKLTTDSLDWDRKNNLVTTQDKVNITKDNTLTTATGAKGQPSLNKVDLQKDVTLEILPDAQKSLGTEKTVITCDGPLEIDYAKNIAVFNNNVKVDRPEEQIYSDIMEIYFKRGATKASQAQASLMSSKIDKIISKGSVKIVRGQNVSYSDEAVYSTVNKNIVLSGRPKLVVYSSEDLSASFGDKKPL